MRIKMCSIHVDDPARAFAFYTHALGFEELLAVPDANLFIVRSPEDRHGVGLLLEPSDSPIGRAYKEGVYAAGLPAIVLGSRDVHAADASGTSVVFDDTCGNYVQISQD